MSALKYLFDNGVIMNRAFMVSIIIGICVLSGCGGSSSYDKKYNETRAMSFLKKYQTANSLYQVEYGSYTSLKMLYEDGSSGVIDKAFYQALDDQNSPQPLSGYLFTSIDKDSDGSKLDRTERTGLCAYPEKPGESGDLIICTLSDPRHFEAEELEGGGFTSHGEEWNFYIAGYQNLGEPIRKWPTDEILKNNFTRIQKRNPTEGLQEARKMAEVFQKQ